MKIEMVSQFLNGIAADPTAGNDEPKDAFPPRSHLTAAKCKAAAVQ
jgi:hypothetical protein